MWTGDSLRTRMVGVGRVALVKGILGISEGYGRNLRKPKVRNMFVMSRRMKRN